MENPTEYMKHFQNLSVKSGKTIKAYNLKFIKLLIKIPEVIYPTQQAALVHYYNILPPAYHNQLEEKNIDSIGPALKVCLEFEDQNLRPTFWWFQPENFEVFHATDDARYA